MNYNRWKQLKRSGGFRRKIAKNYQQLKSLSTTQSLPFQQNFCQPESTNACSGSVQNISFEIFTEKYSYDQSENHNLNVNNETLTEKNLHSATISEELIENATVSNYSSDSSSDTFSDEADQDEEFCDNIKNWAIKFNVPHEAIRELSVVINKRLPQILPKDPRTLLNTTAHVDINPMGTGQYWHNGLKKCLNQIGSHLLDVDKISLNINIDGLPIYKSSKHQLWPILFNIHEKPMLQVMVVGIFAGQGKPDIDNYLRMFVDEMKELIENGLTVLNDKEIEKKILVGIRAIICDSPARAFIKGVCNFNGKDGCLKCTIKGEYSYQSHTVIFKGINYPKRNDQDFREKKYGQHHKADSPLLELSIDIVEDVPVGDALHLIDLGIMKRLLIGWRDGSLGKYITKWCSRDIEKVSNFLKSCKTPKEIHRSVRTLDVLAHWKASEYRTFLYYLSFIILSTTLNSKAYNHFLCFFCGITILSNENYFVFLRVAKELLKSFIVDFKNIYSVDFMTSNIHNLSHLADEVERFGKLQSFSAYPFENKLYTIKKMVRQGNKPLSQIAKRMSEGIGFQGGEGKNISYPFLKKCGMKSRTVLALHLENFILSPQRENKWFLSAQNHVVEIEEIISDNDNNIFIHGKQIESVTDVFDTPIKSSYLNIYKCESSRIKKLKAVYRIEAVKCKLVVNCFENNMFFAPLLHTL